MVVYRLSIYFFKTVTQAPTLKENVACMVEQSVVRLVLGWLHVVRKELPFYERLVITGKLSFASIRYREIFSIALWKSRTIIGSNDDGSKYSINDWRLSPLSSNSERNIQTCYYPVPFTCNERAAK